LYVFPFDYPPLLFNLHKNKKAHLSKEMGKILQLHQSTKNPFLLKNGLLSYFIIRQLAAISLTSEMSRN